MAYADGLLCRGNLRKQGTIARRGAQPAAGARYQKQREVARHSLVTVHSHEADETGLLRDFASIRHPVLGDARHGDGPSNDFLQPRHGLERSFVHVHSSRFGDAEAVSALAPDLGRVLESLGSD